MGDSAAYFAQVPKRRSQPPDVVPLTADHRFTNPDERERLAGAALPCPFRPALHPPVPNDVFHPAHGSPCHPNEDIRRTEQVLEEVHQCSSPGMGSLQADASEFISMRPWCMKAAVHTGKTCG